MDTPEAIAPAQVQLDTGVPYATNFADIYHSPDGAAEVYRVFIAPSGLADREPTPEPLWVGELGFGSGLNFAALAEQCRHQGQRLHFVSCDAAPLAPATFSQIASQRSATHPIYGELARAYPPLISGWHRRQLAGGLITLSVFWGDAQTALAHLARQPGQAMNSWLLDGFAPDRNPGMWSEALLGLLGNLCAPGATVATFTAAGRVRRGLQAAGFEMRRVDQRPHKRESLAGIFRGRAAQAPAKPRHVAVIGAGLAGASVARQIAVRDVPVTVYEAGPAPAAGASGIPVSMLHPRLLADGSTEARLRAHAFLYSGAQVDGASPQAHSTSGALQLPGKNASEVRLRAIAERYHHTGDWLQFLDVDGAQERSGWELDSGGLRFPDSRRIHMPKLIGHLLDHPNIAVRCAAPIRSLTELSPMPTVLACGTACRDFAEAAYLELAAVAGQIDVVEAARPPRLPLLGNGYVVPWDGKLALGSTYEYSPWDQARATQANLSQLPQKPDGKQADTRWLSRHRGMRCVSSDRLPVVGALFDRQQRPIPDLYVSSGMGSMGNVFSHYGAELLASEICGEFLPATSELVAALSSRRFRQRQERRGYKLDAQP